MTTHMNDQPKRKMSKESAEWLAFWFILLAGIGVGMPIGFVFGLWLQP